MFLKNVRQFFFSATMPPEIMAITENFQNDPVVIKTLSKSRTVEAIDQSYYVVNSDKKADALYVLWLYNAPKSSMIFCNTKKWWMSLQSI